MAAETSADAYLPVSIVLFKLHLEFLWERFRSIFTSTPTTNTKEEPTTIEFHSSWDLYLMVVLLGLIGALYTIRRQRVAFQQQPPPPVQVPVQF